MLKRNTSGTHGYSSGTPAVLTGTQAAPMPQMIEVVNVLPNMPNVFKALATRWLTLVETFLFG